MLTACLDKGYAGLHFVFLTGSKLTLLYETACPLFDWCLDGFILRKRKSMRPPAISDLRFLIFVEVFFHDLLCIFAPC